MRNSFQEMLNLQRELDMFIVDEGMPDSPETIHYKRKVAAIIEIGEMLNELEDHKFWKIHKKQNLEKAKEEWVDVMHFILSMFVKKGLDYNSFSRYTSLYYNLPVERVEDELDLLLHTVIDCEKMQPTRKGLEIIDVSIALMKALIDTIYCYDNDKEAKMLYECMLILLLLSEYLGFEGSDDIRERYTTKNRINFERKANKY